MENLKTYKVFLIEDDSMLAEEIALLLSKWQFDVTIAKEFDRVLDTFDKVKPHVVLMDINIPSFDGFYWCKKIREVSSVPIIYVSSRDSNMDIIMGVNSGGDDYIQKPFNNELLLIKLQAIIRRTYEYGVLYTNILSYKGLSLNLDDTTLKYHNHCQELTKNEFKILKLLLQNQGKVVSREALMRSLWDDDIYVNENTLTVNVNRVRAKIVALGLEDFIVTKKGMGYIVQ